MDWEKGKQKQKTTRQDEAMNRIPRTASSKYFKEKVLEVVSAIPEGEILTYKQVAEKAGNPQAMRAVGNILNKNTDPNIPCHRVICSDGSIGGYNKEVAKKQQLLNKEEKKK